MSIRSLAARGLNFAHLGGLSAKAAKAEDDEEKKDARAEGDSDDEEENTDRNRDDGDAKKSKKAKAAEDDEDDQGDDGQKSGKKAKSEDGDETKDYASEDDDDDQGDDGQKSGKRAKAEEDEDDEDEEMRGKSAVAKARRREQARCAAIFACKAAARNPEMAANLAFNTRMPRQEAIAVLRSAPAAVQPGQGRQARNPSLGAGGEMHRNPAAAASAGWDRSFAKVTGKR
jgi:AAA ATPase containing von Willebrand factor type A (vWA) domain